MKRISIYLLSGLMAGSVLTTACDDQLSALPTQSKVEGNVVVDQSSAIVALNGIYYLYAQCGIDYYGVPSTQCAETYEIYPANIAGLLTYYQGPSRFEIHGNTNYQRRASNLWTPFYHQMTAINAVIQQVSDAPKNWFAGNKQKEILAEAHCMRGIVNYNLLRYFGYSWDTESPYGNILRTEPSSSKNLSSPRSGVKETYKAILDDLDFAIENGASESANYYTNKWVAMGQKVRTLMMRGTGSDYQDAAALAKQIIDNSPYELEAYTIDIFHELGLKSKEVMFGIKPQNTGGQQVNTMEAYYYYNESQYYYTENFYNLFENDVRKDKLISEEMVEGERQTTVCKHFAPDNIVANEVEETNYMMRLTEIYLLRAEALARTGDVPQAKELLKTVMEHAGISDFSRVDAINDEASFMAVYFEEFLKNLFCENGSEHELMFRMPKEIVFAFNPEYYSATYGDNQELISIDEHEFGNAIFAIPADEFQNNKALTKDDQNPGYSSSLAD